MRSQTTVALFQWSNVTFANSPHPNTSTPFRPKQHLFSSNCSQVSYGNGDYVILHVWLTWETWARQWNKQDVGVESVYNRSWTASRQVPQGTDLSQLIICMLLCYTFYMKNTSLKFGQTFRQTRNKLSWRSWGEKQLHWSFLLESFLTLFPWYMCTNVYKVNTESFLVSESIFFIPWLN